MLTVWLVAWLLQAQGKPFESAPCPAGVTIVTPEHVTVTRDVNGRVLSRTTVPAVTSTVQCPPPPPDPGAPGGFVELATATTVRPLVDPATFLPPTRGAFLFPAPYGTQGYRLTVPSDCGGTDCVQSVGYSYWRNASNAIGLDTLYVFVGLDKNRGGSGPTLFAIDKPTGAVTKVGPLFADTDWRAWSSGEGWSFSASLGTTLDIPSGPALTRFDVLAKTTAVVFNISDAAPVKIFGASRVIWQVHASQDDTVHSFTVRDSNYVDLGCGIYTATTKTYRYYPSVLGQYDECQIDRTGRYVLIKEQVDGKNGNDDRFIDLQTNTETILLDEQGGMGHSDGGFTTVVGADNWLDYPAIKLWAFGTTPAGPGTLVYRDPSWASQSAAHVSWTNAIPGAVATQAPCGSSASAASANGPRSNEIVCFLLDGSLRTLVVAPVMTDLDASGGGDEYTKMPKGNLDVSGEYFVWTSNLGGARQDAFVVRVPRQRLTR